MTIDYSPVIRGDEALEALNRIKGRFTDENIVLWRNVCCVVPDIGGNHGTGMCRDCPIGVPPSEEEHGWCHDWYVASVKLRSRKRIERIEKYVGKFSHK